MTTPPPPPPMEPQVPAGSGDDKTMALICHFGMVLFGFWPALIIYLVKGDNAFVKREAAKAFNFSVGFTVVWFFAFILQIAISSLALSCLFTLLIIAAWIAMAAFGIMAGIKVNDGKESTYPFELPLLK